ncbi:MAG: hypothetical protein HUU35_08860 [Armatimonadetes bacterium]|nr:hypothetical protein [Armatimonadota bacterium]
MLADPEDRAWDDAPVAQRFWGYLVVLAVVAIATPVPTAALLAALLRLNGAAVSVTGAVLTVNSLPPRALTCWWTAMPFVVVGVSWILAQRVEWGKRVGGAIFLALNGVLISLLSVGFALQDIPAPAADARLLGLHLALETLLLVAAIGYWTRRVAPERPLGRIGHARELLGEVRAEEKPSADG